MWDSEDTVIYLKSSDASGMPSIKTLDYSVRENGHVAQNLGPNSDFITKSDLSSIEERLLTLESKYESLNKDNRKKEMKNE